MWKLIKKQFESTDSIVSLVLGMAVVLVIGMTIVNYVKSKGDAVSTTKQEEAAKEAAKSPAEKGELPTKHTVMAGETLWTISEKYYKSGYNWVDVAKANTLKNANVIAEGQILTIPNVTPIPVPTGSVSSAATTNKPEQKSYTVVRGDTLWSIAQKVYSNGYRWSDIAVANKLVTPNVIHAGNVLMMP